MLNNPQRHHHVSGHVLYPHYAPPAAPIGHFDYVGYADPVLGAYRQQGQDVQQQHSMYARDTHLAPPSLPAQHSALPPHQSYAPSTTLRSYEPTLSHRPRAFPTSNYRHPAAPICAQPYSIMDDEQYAQMQQLSAEYEPEVKGPLTGQLQSSNVIIQEFSTADPIYQRKTVSLASTYSHLRTIRGDGQCGWRAVAFAYFERLLSSRDPSQLLQAETRLRSSVNLIRTAGIAADIYEDFSAATYELLRDLSGGLKNGTADAILLDRFNDEETQNYIIYQMRSLTTAWIKSHAEEYINFLLDRNIDSYCEHHVMPVKSQMDQVSLMALNHVLLAPAGIGLEVEYLDLSPGQDVTLHHLKRDDQSVDMGVVRLLYRPGHYDILYKPEDLAPPPVAAAPPVAAYLVSSPRAYNDPISELSNAEYMYMIPGMSVVPSLDGWAAASHFDYADIFDNTPTPQQPCPQPIIEPSTTTSKAPMRTMQQNFYLPPQPAPMIAPREQAPDDFVIRTANLHNTSRPPGVVPSGLSVRLTDWHHKQDFTSTSGAQVQLQTSQFKNSHYNPAHHLNPDFQPEAWSPEKEKGGLESHSGGTSSKNGKHRRSR